MNKKFQLCDLDQLPTANYLGASSIRCGRIIDSVLIQCAANQSSCPRLVFANCECIAPFCVCTFSSHFYLYISFTLLSEPLRTPRSPSLPGSHPTPFFVYTYLSRRSGNHSLGLSRSNLFGGKCFLSVLRSLCHVFSSTAWHWRWQKRHVSKSSEPP